ncbi:hypothetical protein Vadar_011007 [Vaccinium darrowii]|uniref:Uncharacterized protein n=1 Tax=Vaccinium darrowii TaxID=229202 RepID=A0ACB7YKP3_9ERIC|nr:hypothetical protein Vadar_011007 [Vaccinium darrowii]
MQLFGGSENTQSLPAPIAFGNNAFKMYVFNRNGVCTPYKEWNRLSHSRIFHQDQNGQKAVPDTVLNDLGCGWFQVM